MIHELTIEAAIEPGDGLLTRVGQVLHAASLSPQSLVWSAIPQTAQIRIWVSVAVEDSVLKGLADDFGKIPGVHRVVVLERRRSGVGKFSE